MGIEIAPPVFDADSQEFAWACGFFEGEGSVIFTPAGDHFTRRLTVGNTDRTALVRLQSAFGCGRIYGPQNRGGNRKPMWHWAVSAWASIEPLLRAMLPWLMERRRGKAEAMLACPPTFTSRGAPRKTHCLRGHSLDDPENIYLNAGGYRQCRACRTVHSRNYAQRRRAELQAA